MSLHQNNETDENRYVGGFHTDPAPPGSSGSSGQMNYYKNYNQRDSSTRAGVIGGIIGALIASAVILLVLYSAGIFNRNVSVASGNGQTITIDTQNLNSQVEAIAEIVPQSVVGIYTRGVDQSTNLFGQTTSQEYAATGSGFIVSEDGYVVTNQHVITDNPTSIAVSLSDDSEYEAKVIWQDSTLDMAVLKIDAQGLQPVTLGDSADVKVGELVVAIGNPLGLDFSRTVTAGIVSAVDRSLVVDQNLVAEDLIQTDAAINSGNSGGPLVNGEGKVIGINTYKASSGEGIGFAIPVNILKPILSDIIQTGKFDPVSLGITGYDKATATYIVPDSDLKEGIQIEDVSQNSPAQKAGLQKGDIILEADGKTVNTMLALKEVIYSKKSGDSVDLTVQRNGQTQNIKVSF